MPRKTPQALPQYEKGKAWTLQVSTRLTACWGYCDWPKRKIVVSRETQEKGIDRETFIHEMLHKLFPWMDEYTVAQSAIELDDALEVFDSLDE